MKKKDNVYIFDENGISYFKYTILDLNKAIEKASELSKYHRRKFLVKTINEYNDKNGYPLRVNPSYFQHVN